MNNIFDKNNKIILAIETSCDETSVAIILSGEKPKILSNIVSSQIDLHAQTGGIVPEVASRAHMESIVPVVAEALLVAFTNLISIKNKKIGQKEHAEAIRLLHNEVDCIAYTAGPGLIGSLLVGYNAAKTMAYSLNLPIIPINHIEGHIYSAFTEIFSEDDDKKIQFPVLALTVSGGHTSLTLMQDHGIYENIGGTLDDAAGEAFDKVAKLLDLGYPGGPAISKLASEYRNNLKFKIYNLNSLKISKLSEGSANGGKIENYPNRIILPRPIMNDNTFNFSFSGLKTAVLQTVINIKKDHEITDNDKLEIAAAFEDAAVDVLTTKTIRAIKKFEPKTVLLAGGVSANKELRRVLKSKVEELESNIVFLTPPLFLCGDNAGMIGLAANFRLRNNQATTWDEADVDSNLKLT